MKNNNAFSKNKMLNVYNHFFCKGFYFDNFAMLFCFVKRFSSKSH